jgi:response regulator RpfG family c-di-GMP phosphodiesterase
MIRPCFLIIDKEYSGSISSRKLVIETAKFNVITAYSGAEAIETLALFPAVNGIVLDAGITDIPAAELCKTLKGMAPSVPIVLIGRPGKERAPEADHYVESFDPTAVLSLLKSIEPQKAAAIAQHDASLKETD